MFKRLLLLIMFILAAEFIWSYFNREKYSYSELNPSVTVLNNVPEGRVLAESTTSDSNSTQSGDYTIKQITIGGAMEADTIGQDDGLPFKISNVTNELVTSKDKNETSMIVSWKTNHSAISQLEYGKNGANAADTIREKEFSYAHTSVISSLQPASVYTYTINSEDAQGNKDTSAKFVIYTGSPNVSLIDVLQNAAQKAFGWAIRR